MTSKLKAYLERNNYMQPELTTKQKLYSYMVAVLEYLEYIGRVLALSCITVIATSCIIVGYFSALVPIYYNCTRFTAWKANFLDFLASNHTRLSMRNDTYISNYWRK